MVARTGRTSGRVGRGGRGLVALGAALALVGGLTGCGSAADAGVAGPTAGPAATAGASATPTPAPQRLAASVRDGADGVPTDEPVRATAEDGELAAVHLVAADGRATPGRIAADGRSWTSTGELAPRTRYTLQLTGAGAGRSTLTRTFTTGDPERAQKTVTAPAPGATVGVGHPLVLTFDHPVEEEHRAAAERALVVRTSRPVGPAAWHWVSDSQVQYRPKEYWPADTEVSVDIDLTGVQFAEGTWGVHDRTVTFTVGRSQVVRIDADRHRAQVVRDGEVVRTMGVSLGKDGFTTRSGVKVIMSREASRRMDSSTVGIGGDEAYDLEVPYAMRLTNSGEFLHGAPWNGRIGEANVSHGCSNLELADARWLMEHALIGDVVETTGTGRDMEADNGLGGAWNVPWDEWVQGSALA